MSSLQSCPKKFVLGYVILPAGAVARSHNLRQTFFANSVQCKLCTCNRIKQFVKQIQSNFFSIESGPRAAVLPGINLVYYFPDYQRASEREIDRRRGRHVKVQWRLRGSERERARERERDRERGGRGRQRERERERREREREEEQERQERGRKWLDPRNRDSLCLCLSGGRHE